MVYLYIDNYAIAPISGSIEIGYDASLLSDLDKAYEINDIELEIEPDPSKRWIFGGEGFLHAAERFNATEHQGAICCEGIEVVTGRVVLSSVRSEGDRLYYTVRIIRSIGEWIGSGASNMFNTLPLEYDKQLVLSTIFDSWEQSAELAPVKYFPVYRDTYVDYFYDSITEAVIRTRSIDDYHPFINIYEVVSTILAQDGYQLKSEFMESDYFRNLYMSGAYSSQDSETIRTAMDFYAKRASSTSAVGSSGGRVYITSSMSLNSVGNFITADSTSTDQDCFDNGNCLSVSGGTISFTPTIEVSMGLEFRIKYRTGHAIESRTQLYGFNRFYLYDSNVVDIVIPNSYVDNRENTIWAYHSYRVMVFDHTDGTSYRLTGLSSSSNSRETMITWSSRSTLFSTSNNWTDGELSELQLEVQSGSSYVASSLDWALYDGYVDEEGTTIVDLTVRTPPDTYSPDSPLNITFMYAESDYGSLSFELLEGSALSPVFAEYPGYGSFVTFEDVAQHSVRQRVVLESLIQMFNLRIYTDELSRRVYIEPIDDIIDSAECFDWSSKIDFDSPILFEDIASEVAQIRTWGYQREDGYSVRTSEGEESMLGDWEVVNSNNAAIDSDSSILNPLFSPSLNDSDGYLVVGDRDDPLTIDTLEFAPRVVTFDGLAEYDGLTQPYIYFHSVADNFTLCFDDREGLSGLNRYYNRQVEWEQSSQYVTLYLRLSPYDVASLSSPLDRRASVLSNFRFTIAGEEVLCRLQQLESYDLESYLTKCKFLIIN